MPLDEDRVRQLFRARFEDSPMPQAIIAPDGFITRANKALGDLLGRSPTDVTGTRPRELRHRSDRGGADALIASLLAGEQPSGQAERIYAHANGSPVPVLIHLSVIWSEDNQVEGLSGFFQDLRILRASETRLERQEQFFAALGQRGHEFAHVLDAAGTFVYISPSIKTLFGFDVEELLGAYAYDRVHPDDKAAALAGFNELVREGGTHVFEFRVAAGDGRLRWVQNTMSNLLHTPIGGVVCNMIDITERRAAEAQLKVAELRNQAIVDTTQEGIWIVAPDRRTEFVNQRMADILGRPLSDLYEMNPADLLSEKEALLIQKRLRERGRQENDEYELDYEHPDGGSRRLRVAARPFAFGDGAFFGSLAMVHDVTAQRRLEEELRHAALHDPLTGLPNRTLLADRLEQAALRQREETDAVVNVFYIDLDQFKLVNDVHGHDIGDQVLRTVADRLSAIPRPHETVARLGGDEFVVLCTCDDEVAPAQLTSEITSALAEPIVVGHHRISLTASIGLAASPPYESTDLLRFADAAMFAAKAAGRAQVRTFDRSLAEQTERAYVVAGELREALDLDALTMHYQPVIELATGTVIGFEALARWVHPDRGAISPTVFVPIAEQMGMARALDRWAVRRSITDLKALRSSRVVAPDTYVAVNLSAQHLAEPDLEESIVAATEAAGVPAHNISLEITEGAVMRDVGASARALHKLRDRGYRIAIDDFGTGHSSLAYLRNFPITALKIDRAFVTDMTEDEDAFAIVTSIVQLAKAIGVDTVSEGVETAEQARQLRDVGCAAAQGWLWSAAVPPGEIAELPQFAGLADAPAGRVFRRASEKEMRVEHGLNRLMELQGEGASLSTIAAALNSEGFRTPNGQRWHQVAVARALLDLIAADES